MPTYEYKCSACNHTFELYQGILEQKLRRCPECGKMNLNRLIGKGSGVKFVGEGFHETDYVKKGKKAWRG